MPDNELSTVTQTALEVERVRKRFSRLIDRACEAFEDIVDNSEDDKARVAAAKELSLLWSKLNGVEAAVGPANGQGATQIHINVGALRDTLSDALRTMRRANDIDAQCAVAELIEEANAIAPPTPAPQIPFETVVDAPARGRQ